MGAAPDSQRKDRVSAPLYLGWPRERPISREETEWRVLRGLATARVPGIVRGIRQDAGSMWPAYVFEAADIKAQQETKNDTAEWCETFSPTRRDCSDWWCAMAWWVALNPPVDWHPNRNPWSLNRSQEIVRWRSYGIDDSNQPSWRWIGREMNINKDTARLDYHHALDLMWAVARRWVPGSGVVRL